MSKAVGAGEQVGILHVEHATAFLAFDVFSNVFWVKFIHLTTMWAAGIHLDFLVLMPEEHEIDGSEHAEACPDEIPVPLLLHDEEAERDEDGERYDLLHDF